LLRFITKPSALSLIKAPTWCQIHINIPASQDVCISIYIHEKTGYKNQCEMAFHVTVMLVTNSFSWALPPAWLTIWFDVFLTIQSLSSVSKPHGRVLGFASGNATETQVMMDGLIRLITTIILVCSSWHNACLPMLASPGVVSAIS
jgi:hypothetical protein